MKLLDRLVALWQQEQPLEALPKPGLDRRAFLKILGSSAAIAAAVPMLDLEALIWTPKPMIVVPGLVGNQLVTPAWMTKEALRLLKEKLALARYLLRQEYGGLVVGQEGMTQQYGVNLELSDHHLKFTQQQFSDRLLQPAISHMAKRLNEDKIAVFGELPVPRGVISANRLTDPLAGLSLRGVRQGYMDGEGVWHDILRFDVIGASVGNA